MIVILIIKLDLFKTDVTTQCIKKLITLLLLDLATFYKQFFYCRVVVYHVYYMNTFEDKQIFVMRKIDYLVLKVRTFLDCMLECFLGEVVMGE
jgi:hypothetical protein